MPTSVGNIEIEITSSIQNAVTSVNNFKNAVNQSSNSSNNLNKNLKDITYSTQKMSGSFNNFGNIIKNSLGIGSLQQSMNTFTKLLKNGFDEASAYIENFNLFNISMQGNIEEALRYQYALNRAFSVNMSDSMRYQGFFQNLASALGLTNDASAMLSRNLTNLTYDLASLYNVDFTTMYSKLQSGIVGQTKPLRSVGIDVTMQTLQPYLYEMGINKKVSELTQAEKVILRYIAILKQSTNAQGDFARTLASPANQLRILKDQMKELTRWFGTLFIGIAGKILPYINAIVIALKEAFKWLSKVFGFQVSDYDYLAASNDIGMIDDTLSDTLDTSEELKKSLAGFDEINVLSDNATNASDVFNVSGYSSTYQTLVDYMTDYDNLMGSVKNKAQELADKILETVGFQMQLNDVTGEYEWIWKGFQAIKWDDIFKGLWDATKWTYSQFNTLGEYFALTTQGIMTSFITWLGYKIVDLVTFSYQKIMDWGSQVVASFYSVLIEQISSMANIIAGGLGSILTPIMNAFNSFVSWFQGKIVDLVNAYNAIPVLGNVTVPTYNAPSTPTITTSPTANTQATYTAPKIPTSVISSKLANIYAYADGGYPTTGQMFIAREAGPELVGNIGGKTAVATNNDIVQAVAQGVASAVSSVMSGGSQTVELIVDDTTFGRVVINSANKVQRNTNLKLQTY